MKETKVERQIPINAAIDILTRLRSIIHDLSDEDVGQLYQLISDEQVRRNAIHRSELLLALQQALCECIDEECLFNGDELSSLNAMLGIVVTL